MAIGFAIRSGQRGESRCFAVVVSQQSAEESLAVHASEARCWRFSDLIGRPCGRFGYCPIAQSLMRPKQIVEPRERLHDMVEMPESEGVRCTNRRWRRIRG